MKKYSLLTAAAVISSIIALHAQAQDLQEPQIVLEDKSLNTGVGFGFHISQFQQDFGIGINVTSPYFVHDRIAVRLKGNFVFNEIVQGAVVNWIPYSNVQVGVIGVGGFVGEHIRLYGEGGAIGLLPSEEFSSEDFIFGGYGTFGFEFFMNKANNYFIEIGAVGTGAREDKIATRPIYSNGLVISTGFRFCLK